MRIGNKNFIRVSSESVDVLIVDQMGSEWIRQCVPKDCFIGVLPTRGVIPWMFSLTYFMKLFLRVTKIRSFRKRSMLLSLVYRR